jgi:hypothetical protein
LSFQLASLLMKETIRQRRFFRGLEDGLLLIPRGIWNALPHHDKNLYAHHATNMYYLGFVVGIAVVVFAVMLVIRGARR